MQCMRAIVHCSMYIIGCIEEVTGDAEVWKTWRCASKDKHVLSNLSLPTIYNNYSVCTYLNFPESAQQTDGNNSGWGYVQHSWCNKGKLCVLKVKQLIVHSSRYRNKRCCMPTLKAQLHGSGSFDNARAVLNLISDKIIAQCFLHTTASSVCTCTMPDESYAIFPTWPLDAYTVGFSS